MDSIIQNKIIYNALIDFIKKKDIDKYERAIVFADYIKENKISVRSFARQFDMDESTVRKFMLVSDIPEEQYRKLTNSGISHDKICQSLRSNDKNKIDMKKVTPLDMRLISSIKEFRPFIKTPEPSRDTEALIKELIDILNRTLIYVDKYRK